MRPVLPSLPLLLLALVACDSEVVRTPQGEGGSAGAPPSSAPTVLVHVVGQRGEAREAIDVLVHTEAGELRTREVSLRDGLHVEAHPGDYVSALWESQDVESGPWRLETVRVTEDVAQVRFYIGSALPPTNPNPAIRVEVGQALLPGADAYAVGLACGGGSGWQSEPASFEVDGYTGCSFSPSSSVVGLARDENQRLLAFDAVEITHVPDAVATVLFPSTPIERRTVDLEIATMAGWSLGTVLGGIVWRQPAHAYDEAIDGLPAYGVTLPLPLKLDLPTLPLGDVVGSLTVWLDGPGSDAVCHEASLSIAESATWIPTRLRRVLLAEDESSYVMVAADPSGAFEESGDGLAIELDGARLWAPVPEGTESQPVPHLQIPGDLPQVFGSVYLGGRGVVHHDRFDVEGYAAYVANGVGETTYARLRGEQLRTSACAGRF